MGGERTPNGQKNDVMIMRLAESLCEFNGDTLAYARVKAGIELGIRLGLRRALTHMQRAEMGGEHVESFIRRAIAFELEKGLIAAVPLDGKP